MRTGYATFRHLILLASTLLLALPACTGISGPLPTGGLPLEIALGGGQAEADLFSAGATLDCIAADEPVTEVHQAMVDALNAYRLQNGLKPLRYSKRLEAAANAHVRDLWERSFFAHVNPDGLTPGDRALEAGFCHEYVGENLAAGQPTVQRATEAWIESPPHNDNLLEPNFAYAGMGHFVAPTGRQFWGQLFAFDLP